MPRFADLFRNTSNRGSSPVLGRSTTSSQALSSTSTSSPTSDAASFRSSRPQTTPPTVPEPSIRVIMRDFEFKLDLVLDEYKCMVDHHVMPTAADDMYHQAKTALDDVQRVKKQWEEHSHPNTTILEDLGVARARLYAFKDDWTQELHHEFGFYISQLNKLEQALEELNEERRKLLVAGRYIAERWAKPYNDTSKTIDRMWYQAWSIINMIAEGEWAERYWPALPPLLRPEADALPEMPSLEAFRRSTQAFQEQVPGARPRRETHEVVDADEPQPT